MPAAGILGWKRSKYYRPILHNSKSPETSRRSVLEYIKNIGRRKHQRGPTSQLGGWERAHPYWAHPLSPGPPGSPPVPTFCYIKAFALKKIREKLLGRSAAISRQNLGRTNLELWRSCSAGRTSLREGEIIAIIITIDPLIERGSIYINIFTSTISSQNPSSTHMLKSPYAYFEFGTVLP